MYRLSILPVCLVCFHGCWDSIFKFLWATSTSDGAAILEIACMRRLFFPKMDERIAPKMAITLGPRGDLLVTLAGNKRRRTSPRSLHKLDQRHFGSSRSPRWFVCSPFCSCYSFIWWSRRRPPPSPQPPGLRRLIHRSRWHCYRRVYAGFWQLS